MNIRVKTIEDFTDLEEAWGFKYPKLGEVLQVTEVKSYDGIADINVFMLKFKNYDSLPWMTMCDYTGKPNFEIIMPIRKMIDL